MSVVEHVRREISKLPMNSRPQLRGDSIWICCPFHGGGREQGQSCKINLDHTKTAVGQWYCFGCPPGRNHGPFTDIAKHFGLVDIDRNKIHHTHLNVRFDQSNLDRLMHTGNVKQMPGILWPASRDWRGIPGKLIHDLGGRMIVSKKDDPLLQLPVVMMDDDMGYVNCIIERQNKKQLAYFNSSGMKKENVLFPYDYAAKLARKKRYFALVEGPRDALHWLAHGIPTFAILGSRTSWHSKKGVILRSLGCVMAIMAFDPDDAGGGARNRAAKYLKRYLQTFELEYLKSDYKYAQKKAGSKDAKPDPATLSPKRMRNLRSEFEDLAKRLTSSNRYR